MKYRITFDMLSEEDKESFEKRLIKVLSKLDIGSKIPVKVSKLSVGGRKSKVKGRTFEKRIGEILGHWWWEKPFRHTPGSGAWDKQAKDGSLLAPGDLVIPNEANCSLFVECKKHKQIGQADLIGWWEKCKNEAETFQKIPVLVYAEDFKSPVILFDKDRLQSTNTWLKSVSGLYDYYRDGVYFYSEMDLMEFLEKVEKKVFSTND